MKTKFTFLISCLFFATPNYSQLEIPSTVDGCYIVEHDFYALCYSEEHEQAEWVAYDLTAKELSGTEPRTENFREDPSVETKSAALDDYKGSGYDRGHLAPAADMKFSCAAMSESFLMSNMSPQVPGFNRGIWKKLESLVRSFALDKDTVYVVTGPVFKDNLGRIGTNKVTVPGYYYKVVLAKNNAIGFILPHEASQKGLKEFVVTVDSVESFTGIDFFPALDDSIEVAIESTCHIDDWDFTIKEPSHSSSPSSIQCLGTAKSTGVRCKNRTTNSNGYCHHHQEQSGKSTGSSSVDILPSLK